MISAETVLDYGSHRIDKYTYYDCPLDCANSGKDRISYEVYDNSVNNLIEAFDTLDEAIEHTENEVLWEWCLTDSLPTEVQEEHSQAAKALLIWAISNIRWIAAHEGEQGVERFIQEVRSELKSA